MTMATVIKDMRASDLIGRLILNPHGVEYVCTDVTLDARTGKVLVWIDELDLDNGGRMHAECGLVSLKGFTVSNTVDDV